MWVSARSSESGRTSGLGKGACHSDDQRTRCAGNHQCLHYDNERANGILNLGIGSAGADQTVDNLVLDLDTNAAFVLHRQIQCKGDEEKY